ncbi:MAG: hypothetical protein KC731_35425 [Myxococcales bacterium]|nr:hypothetical protein [Myxococcales bacterium]
MHDLLVAAMGRLELSRFAQLEEPDITGRLVEAMREVVEGPARPRWAWRFAIHDDKPVSGGEDFGKDRPRIDIEIERTTPGEHPRFQFEAKRLYRTDSVAEYVGPKGLGAFLSGTYGSAHEMMGMLGYVQADTIADWLGRIEGKLKREQDSHGLAKDSPVWAEVSFHAELTSRQSDHHLGDDAMVVIHTFLGCC